MDLSPTPLPRFVRLLCHPMRWWYSICETTWRSSLVVCRPRHHFARMRSLKGLLMDTSKGWSMLVMPPGITMHSVLMDLKVLRTGLDKWALNESQTSIDFRQSCTSCLSIQPFAWHLTTTSFGKFKFLGSVFRLNTTYGGSLVPSPRQASITVNLSLSWPVLTIGTLLTPLSDTVLFVTMSNVSGVWSALPMHLRSKSCSFRFLQHVTLKLD